MTNDFDYSRNSHDLDPAALNEAIDTLTPLLPDSGTHADYCIWGQALLITACQAQAAICHFSQAQFEKLAQHMVCELHNKAKELYEAEYAGN